MRRIMYISRSRVPVDERDVQLAAIGLVSKARNAAVQVTGVLVYSATHFAQVLEGSAGDVGDVMESISADARHCEVDIIEDKAIAERRFAGWMHVCSNRSSYIQLVLDRCRAAPTAGHSADVLLRMFEEFDRA